MTTWDPDYAGGFSAKPQEYNYKFLGERNMLGVVHAKNSPEHPCPTDGQSTACNEDWEMRHNYVIEVTPRPEKTSQILQSKTIVYIDGELWFNPYVDSYDRRGELWKTQIYLSTYRDRPVPDAKVAIYPFEREFVLASSSIDVQTGQVTTCYLRAPTLPSVNAGTSTWARSIASSLLPMRWSKPVTNRGGRWICLSRSAAPC